MVSNENLVFIIIFTVFVSWIMFGSNNKSKNGNRTEQMTNQEYEEFKKYQEQKSKTKN